ncbi:MAG: JAB domain-containing protein, partial [bacterium]
ESKENINRSMLRKVVGGSIPLIEMEKLLRPCNGKFLKQQGVGRTKRVALAIIDELYQRFHNGEYRAYQVQLKKSIEEKRNVEEYFFASPKDVKKYFEGKMRPLPIEQLKVVCFDSNKRVKHVLNYSNGQKHYSVISASTMMSIIQNSAGVLFVHNHPSGNCLPSPEDVSFTMRVLDLCKEYHCHFIDHVIIGHKEEFSFIEALKEKGWL